MKRSLMFLATTVFLTYPALTPAEPMGPKDVVVRAVSGVIKVLKARKHPDALTQEERDAIRLAVQDYFDFDEMAKRSVGKPWRNMPEEKRQEFVEIFRELLERSYGNRLAAYHNQEVEYGEVYTRGNRAVVDTEVIDGEKRIPVRYTLHLEDGDWRIYDIKIEGISLVSTFRTDFRQTLEKEGVNGLIAELKRRVEKLRKEDKSV